MKPGNAPGVTDEPLNAPALPNEAPSPGLPGSTRNTLCPSRCSQRAAQTPTMPAPITPTRRPALDAIGLDAIWLAAIRVPPPAFQNGGGGARPQHCNAFIVQSPVGGSGRIG